MLAFNWSILSLSLLQLLPGIILNEVHINLVNDIIEKLHKEKPIETMLLMQHSKDIDCLLKDIKLDGKPQLRLNEATTVKIKEFYNSETLALVCIAKLDEFRLLNSLAINLYRMREARIIIILQTMETNLKEYLDIISRQSHINNFLNLIVLQLSTNSIDTSFKIYRLQPFPTAKLELIDDFNNTEIFPTNWQDFKQKIARTTPSLYPPGSFLSTNKITGITDLGGSMDQLVREFARHYNIKLQLMRPLNESVWIEDDEILKMVENEQIDIPMHSRIASLNFEYTDSVGITNLFIVVPCGKAMSIGDVYKGLKTYSFILLAAYLMFAMLETFIVLASYRILGHRFAFNYSTIFINLHAFGGVLGLPIGLARYQRSFSLRQILLIMSLFSLVVSGYFNANLSSLLTKHPHYKHIQNFEELVDSGISVVFDNAVYHHIFMANASESSLQIPNVIVFPKRVRRDMLYALNCSYAYQTFDRTWDTVDKFQNIIGRKVFCKPSGLVIFQAYPISGILQVNSIYRESFNSFIHRAHEVGLTMHWNLESIRKMMSEYAHPDQFLHFAEIRGTPLNSEDLEWLWKLLGLSYALATLVFIWELGLAYWQRRPRFVY